MPDRNYGAMAQHLMSAGVQPQATQYGALARGLLDAITPEYFRQPEFRPPEPGTVGKVPQASRGMGDMLLGGALEGLSWASPAGPAKLATAAAIPAAKQALKTSSFTLDYFGQPVRVLGNPSKRQLEGFLGRTKYKAARRVTDPETGDVYVWDANDPALHKMIADQLGIKFDPKYADMIGLD